MTESNATRRWPKFSTIFIKISLISAGLYILASLALPIVLIVHPTIIKHVSGTNFTQTEKFGLDRVFNFYLDVEPTVRIGVWHYRSPLVQDQSYTTDEEYFQKHFVSQPSTIPILIYFHGNAFDRFIIVNYGAPSVVRWILGATSWTLLAGSSSGISGSTSKLLDNPLSVVLRPMNNMYVSNTANHRIQLFLSNDANDTTIACITRSPEIDFTQMNRLHWTILDSQLNLNVADTFNHRIQKFERY
ncbi:unnamed protein product [Rotaria sp. Silwood1]|nr:unnamed protein product [Rotaria sp. Silwood1]